MTRTTATAAVALVALVVAVVTDCWRSPARVRVARHENGVRAVEDGDRESPRDRWDPAWVVERIGRDPQALFAWVRDNTSWIPYRGVLRGPAGVLMDREGNSLDRALLLSALLQTAGHSVRLAHGELPLDASLSLLRPLIRSRRIEPALVPGPSDLMVRDVSSAAAQYGLDQSGIAQAMREQNTAISRTLTDLVARTSEQSRRLTALLPSPQAALAREYDDAVEALRDHWWAQVQRDGRWTDLDPLTRDAQPWTARMPASGTSDPGTLDASLQHEIVVRVVVEYSDGGALKQERALEHVIRPADAIGQPITLQFWPASWLTPAAPAGADAMRAVKQDAVEQREWIAALMVGREIVAMSGFADQGASSDPLGPNAMGGLGGAIARGAGSPVDDERPLTAAWIQYEFREPGRAPRAIHRTVFDLAGPSMRKAVPLQRFILSAAGREARALALMMRTEILPIACKIAPEFVAHLVSQSLVGNRTMLQTVAERSLPSSALATEELLAESAASVTPLYGVAVARSAWGATARHVFVDRLGLFTRHVYPVPGPNGPVLRDAVDIVANDVGVNLTARDPFALRIAHGVLDTNAEALLAQGDRRFGNAADAFARGGEWIALTSTDDRAVDQLRLRPDVRRRIARDLADGFVVVAPSAPIAMTPEAFEGWWRIDPATGHTLGVGANGWGAVLTERGVQTNAIVVMEESIYKAIGRKVLAHFTSAFATQFVFCAVMLEGQTRSTQDRGASAGELFGECFGDALIIAGLATLPLLWYTVGARLVLTTGARLGGMLKVVNSGGPKVPATRPAVPPATPPATPEPQIRPADPAPPKPNTPKPEPPPCDIDPFADTGEFEPPEPIERNPDGTPKVEADPASPGTTMGVDPYKPMSPSEYELYLQQRIKAREAAERDFAARDARAQAAKQALDAAEAAEDAASDRYEQLKSDPVKGQEAWEQKNAAQRARRAAEDSYHESTGSDYQQSRRWLRDTKAWEDFARRFQAEDLRAWEDLQRFLKADEEWQEWQRTHPGDHSSPERDAAFRKYTSAKDRYNQTMKERFREYLHEPKKGNDNPTLSDCGSAPTVADPNGDTVPAPSPMAKTIGGTIGMSRTVKP